MKITVILSMLVALGMALACSTASATIVIDQFSTPNQFIAINTTFFTGIPFTSTPPAIIGSTPAATYTNAGYLPTPFGEIISTDSPNLVLGEERDVRLALTSAAGDAGFNNNGLLHSTNGTGSVLLLQYDGVDTSPSFTNGRLLNDGMAGGLASNALDLTQAGANNAFVFTDVMSDFTVTFTVTVYSASTSATRSISVGPSNTLDYYLGFNSFGGFDFTSVRGIDFIITSDITEDVNIGSFEAAGVDPVLLPAVPEPASLVVWSMLGLGGLGMSYFRRRKPAA
ncbi:hypothetical protein NA78x_000215 [Anatilimnocola sp. NA78]|uniref:hypothetical protein n=1 Tax=Anatilimnocola sp. NA78 TaxID=3415683 RepID=UPI003CE5B3A5